MQPGGTCDGSNLFPHDKNFNDSTYKVFYENKIKAALNDSNQAVGQTTIKFDRENLGAVTPDSLELNYTVNGKTETLSFLNEPNVVPEKT
ncbi:hypothetical protein C3F00_005065 [Pseudomonas sp. MWU13-2860]|nr:hypothetical protein C3F00_005065 [Pseudomonas sp. MWU13-2860]